MFTVFFDRRLLKGLLTYLLTYLHLVVLICSECQWHMFYCLISCILCLSPESNIMMIT